MSSSLSAVVCQILSVLKILKPFTMTSKTPGIEETQSNDSFPFLVVVDFFLAGALCYPLKISLFPFAFTLLKERDLLFVHRPQLRSVQIDPSFLLQIRTTKWGKSNIPMQSCGICIRCGPRDSRIVSFDQFQKRNLNVLSLSHSSAREGGKEEEERDAYRRGENRGVCLMKLRGGYLRSCHSEERSASRVGLERSRVELYFMNDLARSKVDWFVISLLSPLRVSTSSVVSLALWISLRVSKKS